MISLEIARLADAELGIGLLPFLYPAYILAALFRAIVDFQWMGRTSKSFALAVKGVNGLLWIMLVVVFAIKVAAYSEQGLSSRDGREPVERYVKFEGYRGSVVWKVGMSLSHQGGCVVSTEEKRDEDMFSLLFPSDFDV